MTKNQKKKYVEDNFDELVKEFKEKNSNYNITKVRICKSGNIGFMTKDHGEIIYNPISSNCNINTGVNKQQFDYFDTDFISILPDILKNTFWYNHFLIKEILYEVSPDKKSITFTPVLHDKFEYLYVAPKTLIKTNCWSGKKVQKAFKNLLASLDVSISDMDYIIKDVKKSFKQNIDTLKLRDKDKFIASDEKVRNMIGSNIPDKILNVFRMFDEELEFSSYIFNNCDNSFIFQTHNILTIKYNIKSNKISFPFLPTLKQLETCRIAYQYKNKFYEFQEYLNKLFDNRDFDYVLIYSNKKAELSFKTYGFKKYKTFDLQEPYKRELTKFANSFINVKLIQNEVLFQLSDFKKKLHYSLDDVPVSYELKDDDLHISFALNFRTYNKTINVFSSYKNEIKKFMGEMLKQEIYLEKLHIEDMKKSTVFGSILATAIGEILLKNHKYITVNTLPKILRNLSFDLWGIIKPTIYDRKFNMLTTQYVENTINKMKEEGFLCFKTGYSSSSKYSYVAIEQTSKTKLFVSVSKLKRKDYSISDPTEFEILDILKNITDNMTDFSIVIQNIDYLIEHPACYCFDEVTCKNFLKNIPEEGRDYMKVRYQLEENRDTRKYMRTYMAVM